MTEIGRLIDAMPRDAWANEAQDFTPWLADHIDQLGEVLGIKLELEGREVAVEAFSADILARNVMDDSLVLIENQLEQTDHTHLGQVMTYLAGLNAQTVIWIATDFREPHLSAIKWLNEHTVEPFAFFAVRLRVVRIGDSPIAPIFDVLERPNEWERRLQSIAHERREVSEVGQFRRDYWAAYAEQHPEDVGLGVPSSTSNWWVSHGTGQLIISLYVSVNGVGAFVRGRRGSTVEETRELIQPNAPAICERLGVELISKNYDLLHRPLYLDMRDRSNWPEAIDWMHETAHQYRAALTELLEIES